MRDTSLFYLKRKYRIDLAETKKGNRQHVFAGLKNKDSFLIVIRVSNVIDYSLTRNYVQLREIIFISCNFAVLRVIGEISISRNYGVISRNFYNVIS